MIDESSILVVESKHIAIIMNIVFIEYCIIAIILFNVIVEGIREKIRFVIIMVVILIIFDNFINRPIKVNIILVIINVIIWITQLIDK